MGKRAKEFEVLIQQAARAGFDVIDTKAGWRLLSPDGVSQVTVHRSGATDRRALANFRSQLRRAWPDDLPGRP